MLFVISSLRYYGLNQGYTIFEQYEKAYFTIGFNDDLRIFNFVQIKNQKVEQSHTTVTMSFYFISLGTKISPYKNDTIFFAQQK